MSKRQIQKMMRLLASGGPVELTSPMASVKKLARLAFVAQQFGYEYADVKQSSGRNGALVMLIVPDPSPTARARAAQNWAQYPNAGDGVSVPPLVPDAFELLKARIQFDLTGKNAERRAGYGALGVTIGCVILAFRLGGETYDFIAAFVAWLVFLAILGVVFVVNRKRNVKYAARLQAAGFTPVTDETGRVRYLPPGAQLPGQGNPFGGAMPAGPYGASAPGAPGGPGGYIHPAPGAPYPPQPSVPAAPGQYAAQPAPGPYAAHPGAQPAPGPYGTPYPQQYAQPQQPPMPQQAQQPHPPQQNPHWQPPQH